MLPIKAMIKHRTRLHLLKGRVFQNWISTAAFIKSKSLLLDLSSSSLTFKGTKQFLGANSKRGLLIYSKTHISHLYFDTLAAGEQSHTTK